MTAFRATSGGLRAGLAAVVLGAASLGAQAFSGVFDAQAQKALGAVGGALMDAAPPAPAGVGALGERLGAGAAKPAQAAPAPDARAADFRYSPAVSAKVREQVIQTLADAGKQRGTLDAAGEKTLREALGKVDVMKTIGGALQAKGYPPHSLATASAYWLMINYEIVRGVQATDRQNAAVLRQMQQRMAATPDIGRMSDAQKQHAAEAMLWLGTLQYQNYQQARQGAAGYDPKVVQADARAALKGFNIDVDRLALTDQGLVPR